MKGILLRMHMICPMKNALRGPIKEAQSFLEKKARTKKVRVMSRKRNFRNSEGPRPFSSGFSFSNVYPQEPRSFPLTCWRCKRPGHFARFCQAPIPPNPAQFRGHDNETILSRDRVLDIECDSDFNLSFDLANFCSDAGFVESNVKSVISSPPDEASPNVKDRLSKNIEFWHEIGASPWVLKVLQGYAIPFLEMPPKASFKNKSALNHPDFVSSEVLNLLDLGCVKEISRNDVHVISPLSVVDNGSKLRLILDLSYLNKFLSVPKSRYEDIREIRDLFRKGDYFSN